MHLFLSLKSFWILVFVLFFQNIISQESQHYLTGVEHYNRQDYIKAIELFQHCLTIDSTNISCLEKAGLSSYQLGDIPSAKRLFLELEQLDSLNFIAFTQLSSIYDQENNIPKAIKYYTKLKQLVPENPVFHRKLAQQYLAAGLHGEAFIHYSNAHKLNQNDVFTLKGLTEIFLVNRQFEQADSILLKGLSMDSMNVNFNLLMAQSKYKQKAFDSTVFYLKRIQYEIDFNAYYNKMFGYAYIQIDSFERSIPYLEKSLADEGSKEYAHYYLANAYEKLNNLPYAIFHYEKALEEGISSNVSTYHRSLAKLLNDENNLKEAILHYQDAYKYSKDPVLLFLLARASDIYYKDKNIAINYYKRYLASSDSNAEYKKYANERKIYLQEQEFSGME